jgi:peptide methionine sulfoxide reductase MsrA
MLALLVWTLPAADVGLYFGCGCFWHVQHELIEAEREVLGRTNEQLTALSGYAGGQGPGSNGGRACYHGDPDNYNVLGHTEVVYVSVPREKIREYAEKYWSLFVGINRVDIQDVGPEYRAAIGVPNLDEDIVNEIRAAQTTFFEMKVGEGSDPDTLGKALVWLYDAAKYPFFQGEIYHQFHDDMVEKYDTAYHNLKGAFIAAGKLQPTGCRNDGNGSEKQVTIIGSIQSDTSGMDTVDLAQAAPAGSGSSTGSAPNYGNAPHAASQSVSVPPAQNCDPPANNDVGLYFGCGCFWHVQHELIEAEREVLGRTNEQLTALVGYAGGQGPGANGGRACYHGDSDNYNLLGHTEVVYVSVPREKIREYAEKYWGLFVGINRVDVQDVGPEYRAAIGVPHLDEDIIREIRLRKRRFSR